MPAKNSEAFFGGPRFTRPLRAGKRANANFACSEGFFCARRAAPCGGLVVLAWPAASVAVFAPGPRHFSAGVPLSCPRLAGSLLLLRLVLACAAGVCLPFARRALCAARALSCFPLPPLCSLSKFFSPALRPRRALLSSEKKVDKDSARGAAAAPLRTPLTVPCGCSPPLSRCWPA